MQEKGGFTLIELLVVVLIIGILSAVAVPQYQKVIYKARMQHTLLQAKDIKKASELYYLANGGSAPSAAELTDAGWTSSNGNFYYGSDEWRDIGKCIWHPQRLNAKDISVYCRVCYGDNPVSAYCHVYGQQNIDFFKNNLRWEMRGENANVFNMPI